MPPSEPTSEIIPSDEEDFADVPANESRSKRKRREARSHFTPAQRPRWEAWLMALIPLLICFLGGGRSVFAKGIAASGIGLLMLIAPPGYRLPKFLLCAMAGLVAAPLLSFLPVQMLGPMAEWRTQLVDNWGIMLPDTGTAQPWVTFEAWMIFTVGLVWLAWCASRGTTLDDRKVTLRLLVAGFCVIAVLTLLDKARMIHILWWQFPKELGDTFGPFANRNHTSSLMAMASVLCAATAYDFYRSKQRQWLLILPMLVPFFIVIVTNTSRAGVLLFFLGTTIWIWTAALKKSFFRKLALASALVLAGTSIILVLGGSVSERFATTIGKGGSQSPLAGRTGLYSDVLKMTSASPWTGIGLGSFSDIYPQFASFHEPKIRFLHPESDGLWLMAEGGMLTFIAAAAVILFLASMTGPWSNSRNDESASRQDRRLRHAAAIAAFMAAVHGTVDVPNHSLGYGLVSGMLLALALRPSRVRTPATFLDRAVFRLLGAGVLAAGLSWTAISMGVPAIPGASTARLLAQQARVLRSNNRDGEALKLANQAIEMNPLNWTLYFLRAQLHIGLKHADQNAMLDFGRARAIEPHYSYMCIEEGEQWLSIHSKFAIQAWNEFLHRQPERTDFYGYLLEKIKNDPELVREARKIASTAQLKLICLNYIYDPVEFDEMVSELVRKQPTLEGLEPEHKLELFRLWQQRGNRSSLKLGLQKNLAWQQDGWPVLCDELAREGDYEGAYRLATHYELSPVGQSTSGMQDLSQLEQAFNYNPIDPRRGIDLYFAQKSKLQWNAALATLEKVAGLPNSPPYVQYEMASLYAQKQDFRKAWELISKYLSQRK